MGNSGSCAINYQDVQFVIQHPENYMLINTLPQNEQNCLIVHTINIMEEEKLVNGCIENGEKEVNIIVYGKNCNDEKIHVKQKQFLSLGFKKVYIYTGGLFEWLMLQDIYGHHAFPTTSKDLDILKYAPPKILNTYYLT